MPHAFWNAGGKPALALAIISPTGLERYFTEIAQLLPPAQAGPPDEQALGVVMVKYGLKMDMDSIPALAGVCLLPLFAVACRRSATDLGRDAHS